jgi:hypothetical protein
MMRITARFTLACVILLAACVGSEGNSTGSGLSDWTGAEWSGTETDTFTCGTTQSTSSDSYGTTFFASGSNGLTFTSKAGCTFDFTVSGDTAALSDGPVTCSVDNDAGAFVLSYTSYTFTTSDGLHLSGTITFTQMSGGVTCMGAGTISATR